MHTPPQQPPARSRQQLRAQKRREAKGQAEPNRDTYRYLKVPKTTDAPNAATLRMLALMSGVIQPGGVR